MPMGEWYLMEEAEVVGWNDINEARPGGGEPGSAAHYDDPPTSAQTVYEGPVWISMSIGMLHEERVEEYAERPLRDVWEGSMLPRGEIETEWETFHGFECDGVTAWNEYREHRTAVCMQKTNKELFTRISIQIYFDGMKELLEKWDELALNESLSFKFYLKDDLTQMIAFVTDVQMRAEGSWIRVDNLPDGVWALWGTIAVGSDREWAGRWRGKVPVWKVDLHDARVELSTTEVICQSTECLPQDSEFVIDGGEHAFPQQYYGFDGSVPFIPKGEFAHGIRVKGAWFIEGDILIQGFGELDFIMDEPGFSEKWLFVEVDSISGELNREGWQFIYDKGDRKFLIAELEPMTYFGNTNGHFAVGRNINTQTRAAREGIVLLASIPKEWNLERILLIKLVSGPVWRLR